ncbi:G patch domain-containing protein 11 [Linnemannia zychae]|nr:G patch domain-containing protein 11 [Linnemannia zychae]
MSHQDDEEEEDYMSEAFLSSLVAESTKPKNTANMTYSERRRQKEREHLANLPKPLHVREKEAREQGLEKEIGEDNKGMAMLLKMGFKKGGTLGASKSPPDHAAGSTLTEAPGSATPSVLGSSALRAPLAIQIKQGRGGLGMDTSRKRQAEEELQKQEQEVHRVFDEGFRGKKQDQFEQGKRKRQLGAARAICMTLDAKKAELCSASEIAAAKNKDEEQSDKEGRRSNRFWWIADSMPDEILGTKLMGPGAQVLVDPEQHMEEEQTAEGRAFDHSDDEDGDLERNKAKRVRLDPSVSQGLEQEEVLLDEEPPKWGERPQFAQLEARQL